MTFNQTAVTDRVIPEPASPAILFAGFTLMAGVRKREMR